jgi:hypothetical protein
VKGLRNIPQPVAVGLSAMVGGSGCVIYPLNLFLSPTYLHWHATTYLDVPFQPISSLFTKIGVKRLDNLLQPVAEGFGGKVEDV